jgi:phosphatidylglycerophosphate synthase
MVNFFSIRKDIYKHNLSQQGDNLINVKYPYSSIKGIYYMETASIFLFLTQKIIKSPNLITFFYILTGVVGAFFIGFSPPNFIFYLGLFMVFTKGTFDWADGALARRLNKTSFLGHALDVYGASTCDAAFRVAFVFYTINYYPKYMSLFPVIVFVLLIIKFHLFSDVLYFRNKTKNHLENNKIIRNNNFQKDLENSKKFKGIDKLYYRYVSFLDERARSIDFLILILLVDKIFVYDLSLLLLILSILIILREIVMHVAGIYLTFKTYKRSSNG